MRLIPRSCVSIAWHVPNDKLSSSAISLIVKCQVPTDYCTDWSTVSLVRTVDGRPVCGSSSMDMRSFLNQEYHSNGLDWLNAVSPNAWCSISYISVDVLPSFWKNLMRTRCSFNTSISQYDKRDKHDCTVDQLTHDWVKLPSAPLVCGIRRCCQVSYMVVISIQKVVSLLKNSVLDIFYQTL
jgi:hypothetical protein